ncbi:hypothetical protein ACUW84_000092 [Bacillus sp. 153480031-1]
MCNIGRMKSNCMNGLIHVTITPSLVIEKELVCSN